MLKRLVWTSKRNEGRKDYRRASRKAPLADDRGGVLPAHAICDEPFPERGDQSGSYGSEGPRRSRQKQTEIDNLEIRITSKEAVLDRLITETRTLRFQKYSDKSDGSDGWKDSLLASFSANLMKADKRIGSCIEAIKDYACSGTGCRGGQHSACFWDEEAYAIKKVMTTFAAALQTTLREIGSWLVWLANILHKFNDRELYRADREVKDIADGRYDGHIRRYEEGNGLSR